jgi:replicative DNA helicase
VPDAREHGAFVLGAIVPGRRDLLEKATRVLTTEHFVATEQQMLFGLLTQYHDRVGGVLTQGALDDLTARIDVGRAAIYREAYLGYAESSVGDEQFEWSLDQLRELASERATSEAIVNAMEILRTGQEVDGEPLKGAEDARSYLSLSLGQIDRQMTMQAAPEGDVRAEEKDILSDYQTRKEIALSGASRGVLFGVDALDQKIGGLQRGEVVLIAGYSSDGKTTLLTQLAWSAAIEQGKNVVFFTTETLRDQVRRKILARHSMLEQFGLHATGGINSYDIKNGTIPEPLEDRFREIVSDFTNNPDYGTVYIKQVPRGASLTYLEQSLASLERKFGVDLVCMDYLALLTSERKRGTTREELAAIMKDSKQIATSFGGGKGVPLVSPWQVSRAAREKAADAGKYTSASLSETAEATNTADLIVGLLAPIDNSERRVQVDMQILKNRDGPTANDLRVDVDYGTSWFRSRALLGSAATMQPVHASMAPSSGDPLADLIG